MPDKLVEDRVWLFNVTNDNQLEEGIMRDPGATSVFGEKTMRMIVGELVGPKIPRRSATLQFGTSGNPPPAHTDLGASKLLRRHLDHNPSSGELTDRGNIVTSNRRV